MEKVAQVLLALLRHSLWGTPMEGIVTGLSEDQWVEVYSLACRHTVQGVAFDAVKGLEKGSGPAPALGAKWLLETRLISKRYTLNKRVTEKMTLIWKELGINAVHLKGVRLADMYPVPDHRTCGDIDWYFPEETGRLAANEWAKGVGQNLKRDSDGVTSYVYDGVVVEHHSLPFIPGDSVEDLVMLNLHIHKHAMVQGVGLRQICDLAVAYSHFHGGYDAPSLRADMEKKKLLRWTDLLHHVLVEYIGLPEDLLPWPLEDKGKNACRPEDVEFFVGLVIEDGNFGLSKEHPRSGFWKRSVFFLKYSPQRFVKRWAGLIFGRLFRRSKIKQ